MANQLLTLNLITREATRLWKNTNAFLQSIDMQYDDSYAVSGAKAGATIRIRLPNDYTVRTGAQISIQDTNEVFTSLSVATQKGVDVGFSTAERKLSLDDYSERVLAPMMNNLAGDVAVDVMSGVEGGISGLVYNGDGGANNTGNVLSPTATTYLSANAILSKISAPKENRMAFLDPLTMAKTVAGLAGLFNPSSQIGTQYKDGAISEKTLGFSRWFEDQTVLKHTSGTATTATVNGAGQIGLTVNINALAGTLNLGDVVTIANVNLVNRINKQNQYTPNQFVVTAAAGNGATTLSLYPAIIPYQTVDGVLKAVQYQTVDASPANGAVITPVVPANVQYIKNFVYAREAVTMAMVDLELPQGVHEVARAMFNNCSIRMITAYIIGTDQMPTRTDVLYGYKWVRPEWAVAIADTVV